MNHPQENGGGRIDPRAFCGEVYPWPLIDELSDGEEVSACYLLHEVKRLQTKTSQPYLKLVLGDRTGTIDGMVWDEVERWESACLTGEMVGVRGRVGQYQGRAQLRVEEVTLLRAPAADMERLLPASPIEGVRLNRELDRLIASVEDGPLRALLERCLGSDTELGRAFRVHPAATRNHHAYLYGLLEHTVSVATACDLLAGHYRGQDVPLDRNLLLAGALLHDIGKLEELAPPPVPSYTTPGRLLGHIVLGIQLVEREAAGVEGLDPERLLLLQHLIASHQGRPEWDSPRVPQLREAILLHYADDLDAKLNQAGAVLAAVAPGSWSTYDRGLGRYLYRPDPGGTEDETAERERPPDAQGAATEAAPDGFDLFRDR